MAFSGLCTLGSYVPQWAWKWCVAVDTQLWIHLKTIGDHPPPYHSSPFHHPYINSHTCTYTYVFIFYYNIILFPNKPVTCSTIMSWTYYIKGQSLPVSQLCTWRRALWLKRCTTAIPVYLCYLNVHYHFWWPLPSLCRVPPSPCCPSDPQVCSAGHQCWPGTGGKVQRKLLQPWLGVQWGWPNFLNCYH